MNSETYAPCVWVWNGKGSFPGGLFSTRDLAEKWIAKHTLTGTLTAYPLDRGVYDWATENGYFKTSKNTPEFIGGFSSAYMEHYHYENGECRT